MLSLLLATAFAAETGTPDPAAHEGAPPPKKLVATATLEPRSGSTVTGTVTFLQKKENVKVVIQLAGATPGDHAVHIHEKGDCSAPDATSAGSHFNPEHKDHGDMMSAMHHPGDFGNVTIGADGTGTKSFTTQAFTLAPGQLLSVNALSVIVHEKVDDFSQPTGNAGARQACGVITLKGKQK